jgi:Lrp/AsnC family leucine-responsive transcriptional regulator
MHLMAKDQEQTAAETANPEVLDELDFRIVSLLVENGRASYAAIGSDVGLSAHGAADRVRRLQRKGIIRGYTAVVDLKGIGRALDAVVDVRMLPATVPETFERAVTALPAVREVTFVTGRFDYQVRVACRDSEDLDTTVRAIRSNGVLHTETRIVLRSVANEARLG